MMERIEVDLSSGESRIVPLTTEEVADAQARQPTLGQLKSTRRVEINTACEAQIGQIKEGYPESEVLSWPKQEEEARAFIADANAATPLIDALAGARGIPKAELASRIIAKADLFAGVSGALIGKRQALEDAISAASTQGELDAIAW